MTVPSTTRSGVGFKHCQTLALDANGYPAATDTAEYAGLRISGSRSLSVTDPEPRQIVHMGDDLVFALDVLPPTEPMTAELTVGKINDAVDAMLTDDLSVTVGEAKLFGVGTENRGQENMVCVLAYRQSLDTDPDSSLYGSRRWEFRLFPQCFVIPREGGMTDAPEERLYTVRPQYVKKYPWGVSFATGTEGYEQAQGSRGVSEYKPRLVSFKADNTETSFTFNTSYYAQATGKIVVWVNGTEQTADVTKATTGLEFTTAPTTDAMVVVFYEYA